MHPAPKPGPSRDLLQRILSSWRQQARWSDSRSRPMSRLKTVLPTGPLRHRLLMTKPPTQSSHRRRCRRRSLAAAALRSSAPGRGALCPCTRAATHTHTHLSLLIASTLFMYVPLEQVRRHRLRPREHPPLPVLGLDGRLPVASWAGGGAISREPNGADVTFSGQAAFNGQSTDTKWIPPRGRVF